MTAEELIELYENSIAEHKSVYNNSKFIKTNLLIVNEIFNIIMMNKSFQNILEQENLSELPSSDPQSNKQRGIKMIQIRFGDNFIYLETNKLIPSKELLENVKLSHKYHQIVTSIESLGIIEPIIVFYDKDKDAIKILDGHLRVEALKDFLGIKSSMYTFEHR